MRKFVFRSVHAAALFAAWLALGVPAQAQDVPGVTEDSIKIGVLAPLTGSLSTWGNPVFHGAAMVYKEVNENGGIHGRKIEFVAQDTACDPAKAVAAAKALMHREKVFMINGGVCSGAVMAAREEIIANKVPLMILVASLHKLTEPVSPYVFTVAPTGVHDGETMAKFAATIPDAKTVAFIRHDDQWAETKMNAFQKIAEEKNLTVVANETIGRGATDATSQVLAIKGKEPDVVALFTYPAESAIFLREAHKYGLEAAFVGNNALIDLEAMAERAGTPEALENVYIMSSLSGPVGSTELAPYVELLKKHFPDDNPKPVSFWGTASATVAVEALRQAGPDLTREKVLAALEEGFKDFEVGVAPCKITLSPDNHQGCDAQAAWALNSDGAVVTLGQRWRKVQ